MLFCGRPVISAHLGLGSICLGFQPACKAYLPQRLHHHGAAHSKAAISCSVRVHIDGASDACTGGGNPYSATTLAASPTTSSRSNTYLLPDSGTIDRVLAPCTGTLARLEGGAVGECDPFSPTGTPPRSPSVSHFCAERRDSTTGTVQSELHRHYRAGRPFFVRAAESVC